MGKAGKKRYRQVAALAWRRDEAGALQVALVTSRETRRWILPKGWQIKGMTDADAAATEAMEEAGVIGLVHPKPFGRYIYEKRFPTSVAPVTIEIYALEVQGQLDDWPEKSQRDLKWCSIEEAAEIAADPPLKPLLIAFRLALEAGFPGGVVPKKQRRTVQNDEADPDLFDPAAGPALMPVSDA